VSGHAKPTFADAVKLPIGGSQVPTNVRAVSDARFLEGVKLGRLLCARSIEPFALKAACAADAGPMQIECREGLASRCAETGRRSIADHTARPERVFLEKISQSEPLRKPKERICSVIRRTTTGRGEARRILLMERVVSCGSGEQRWRTKLHFGSRESLDDHHRSSTLGAEPEIARLRPFLA